MVTKRRLVNPRILGIMLVAASLLLVTTGSQNAIGSGITPPIGTDILVEEAAEAGNVTTTNTGMNQTTAKFLSIQNAQSGSISELNATAYRLELDNVSDKTILFSDRPDRIVTSVGTADFVGNWTAGADSLAADPPNAVLVVHDDEQREDIAIVELFNPIYDSVTNTLKYDVILENATSIDIPNEYGQSTVLIDNSSFMEMAQEFGKIIQSETND